MRPDANDSVPFAKPADAGLWPYVTWAALVLLLAMVITRSTMLEYLRDVFPIIPGSDPASRDAGPTTTLLLDLLCSVPALLVLLRASFDETFRLRKSLGNGVMLLLAVWMALSVAWSNDRFAAVVDVATIAAALSLLWATQQLVRDWRTLRIVAAIAVAVLMMYAAHGVIDKYVELPVRQENLKKNTAQMLRNMNVEPGSFDADRLEKKIGNGELLGFSASINTFAAVMVMGLVIAAGALMQRLRTEKTFEAPVVIAVLVIACIPVLVWTSCRAAIGTPVIAGGVLLAIYWFGDWMAAHRRAVATAIALAGAALVAFMVHHGLKTGTMFQDSLNFRWRYWFASWGVWLEHPAIGVGWDSFPFHYLTHRLPIASEEIRDPHNFIVHAFSELGAIGGVLTLLWVGRGFWEMSLPATPTDVEPATSRVSDLGWLAIILLIGVVLGFVASVDFSFLGWDFAIDGLKRLLYLCVGMIAAAVVTLRSMQDQRIDARPAPWIRWAMVAGLVAFLVHNLIDFAMFETSAMFIAAMVAGAAWGCGLKECTKPARKFAAVKLALGALTWVAVLGAVVIPIGMAESAKQDGDELLRTADIAHPSRYAASAAAYEEAMQHGPTNPEYALSAARALALGPPVPPQRIRTLLNAAVAGNPFNARYLLSRVTFSLNQSPPDRAAARSDYERVLSLDPNNVDVRLSYADLLVAMGDRTAAREQYLRALSYNDQLSPEEPKRLSADKVRAVQEKIAQLNGS